MGSSARNRKSGKPDKLPRTPSVNKMASEYLKKKGIPQDPLKPLNFRRKKAKGEVENDPEKNSNED
jgi:hypothetical protein